MKTKVDFTKLLYEWYSHFDIEICLEMINWFLATGLEGDYEVQSGWHRSGINQLIYGYSANNHDHAEPFPINSCQGFNDFMTAIFVRAIVAPISWDGKGKIEEWRNKNKIGMGKYRFFDFPVSKRKETNPGRCDTQYYLWRVAECEGKELKKRYFHPDYPNRTKPKIIKVTFSTIGKGYFVDIDFSFYEFNYEPGWTREIARQYKGEHIGDFLARAYKILKSITVNTEATERLVFETKNNFQTFSDKCCANCLWLNYWKKEEHGNLQSNENAEEYYCDQMRFYNRKRRDKGCMIDDPNNHCCDQWTFEYKDENRNPQIFITEEKKKA